MADADFTHIALHVNDLEASLGFYHDYGGMRVFEQRDTPDGSRVAWLASESKRFVLVLVAPRRMRLRPTNTFCVPRGHVHPPLFLL